MKNKLLLIIFMPISLITFSQITEVADSNLIIKQIYPSQIYHLKANSTKNADREKKQVISIDLPEGTIKWGYFISLYEDSLSIYKDNNNKNLTNNIIDAYNETHIVSESLYGIVPVFDEENLNVYLLDSVNMKIFEANDDYFHNLRIYIQGSKKRFKGGIIWVPEVVTNKYYIGFENTSTTNSLYLAFEAFAVSSKTNPIPETVSDWSPDILFGLFDSFTDYKIEPLSNWNVWSDYNMTGLYLELYKYIGKQSVHYDSIYYCLSNKIIEKYTVKQWAKLPYFSINKIVNEYLNDCFISLNETKLKDEVSKKNILVSQVDSLYLIKDYKNIASIYVELYNMGFMFSGMIYNDIAWFKLLAQDYNGAFIYLEKGLALYPENLFLLGNLANYFLLTNKYSQAEEIYLANKNKMIEFRTWEYMVKSDFEKFANLGILPYKESEIIKYKLGIKD
jgi:hypothetical protein